MSKESELLPKLLECCVCKSQDATKLFTTCLHTICDGCIDKVRSIDGYTCPRCHKISDEVNLSSVIIFFVAYNKWCTLQTYVLK